MILDFFPTCKGRTLNVGVHYFNKDDGVCFENKYLYETIDIDQIRDIVEGRKVGFPKDWKS